MNYRSRHLALEVVSSENNTPNLVVRHSLKWLDKGFFARTFAEAAASGSPEIALDFTPNPDNKAQHDLMAGHLVSEALLFLVRHPECSIRVSGCEQYSKWLRRLDSSIEPKKWERALEQAEQLLSYDDVYRHTQQRQLAEARDYLENVDDSALAWRVALEHWEHFLCGRVEFPHDCSFSAPYRETVRDQLLTFYAQVRELPAWEGVVQELESAEMIGPGDIFSVPVLGEIVSAAQVLGGLGLVATVCATEKVARPVAKAVSRLSEGSREKLETAALVGGGIAAVPLVLGYSALKGLCGVVGRGYVRRKGAKGERIPLSRFSHFAPGTKPI